MKLMELRRFQEDALYCRNEKSKLIEEVDSLHKEKEGYVSENIEMKSKIEAKVNEVCSM